MLIDTLLRFFASIITRHRVRNPLPPKTVGSHTMFTTQEYSTTLVDHRKSKSWAFNDRCVK